MKIEICEQMVQSWLQNYKQCEIVQTNWKVSPLRLRSITDNPLLVRAPVNSFEFQPCGRTPQVEYLLRYALRVAMHRIQSFLLPNSLPYTRQLGQATYISVS